MYEIPLKHWVDNELKEMVSDYLIADNALSKTFVKKDFITKLLHKKIKIPTFYAPFEFLFLIFIYRKHKKIYIY